MSKCYDEAAEASITCLDDVPEAVRALAAYANDNSNTMTFARALETVSSKVYRKKYPEFKARSFVPFSNEGGDSSQFLTFRVWDSFFMAKVVSDYATDFPSVSAAATEIAMKYYDLGISYHYHVRDLQYAAKAGVPLTDELQMAARKGIEQGIDEAVAFGVPQANSYGLVNNPNVSLVTLPNGSWSSATGEQMLEDLNSIVTQMFSTTFELYRPNTILMSTLAYQKIATKLLSPANASSATVLTAFKDQNPDISVGSWTRLSIANAAGNNGRIVAYQRDSDVLEFQMGHEFKIFPPTQQGMQLTYPCMARLGGLAIRHPMGVSYADNQLL